MKRLCTHHVGVDQGETLMFSDYLDGGEMWTGNGPRQARVPVSFTEPFVAAPAVQVALGMWDISNGSNARAEVVAEKITETGFVIVFRTWGDTRVARVRVGWTAIGALPDEDAWEV